MPIFGKQKVIVKSEEVRCKPAKASLNFERNYFTLQMRFNEKSACIYNERKSVRIFEKKKAKVKIRELYNKNGYRARILYYKG